MNDPCFDPSRRPRRLGPVRNGALACMIALAAIGTSLPAAPPVWAQRAPHAEQSSTPGANGPASHGGGQSVQRQLPADATTDQALELPGRTLRFKATAGSIPLNNAEDGSLLAEIAYVAYVMPGDANRPVTFVFNGGPG